MKVKNVVYQEVLKHAPTLECFSGSADWHEELYNKYKEAYVAKVYNDELCALGALVTDGVYLMWDLTVNFLEAHHYSKELASFLFKRVKFMKSFTTEDLLNMLKRKRARMARDEIKRLEENKHARARNISRACGGTVWFDFHGINFLYERRGRYYALKTVKDGCYRQIDMIDADLTLKELAINCLWFVKRDRNYGKKRRPKKIIIKV